MTGSDNCRYIRCLFHKSPPFQNLPELLRSCGPAADMTLCLFGISLFSFLLRNLQLFDRKHRIPDISPAIWHELFLLYVSVSSGLSCHLQAICLSLPYRDPVWLLPL